MLRSVVTTSRRSTWIALATSRRVDSSSVSFSTTTSRALSVRQTLKRVAVGSGLTLLGAGTLGATYLSFSTSESAAGARRTLSFWSRIGPIVVDYYWHTGSKSPLVRYQTWRRNRHQPLNDDRKEKDDTDPQRAQVLQRLHDKHAPAILETLLELKGLYIKLGQVLSVTALPIPEAYRERFRTLQSNVPGWEDFDSVVRPVLEREIVPTDMSLDDIFESIDDIPVGSASIGQAHKARLTKKYAQRLGQSDDDRDVILKVQYPDAAWQVPADIRCVGDFMKICVWAGVVNESAANLSFNEFARQFMSELDYDRESINLAAIHEQSLDPTAPYQKRNVVVPKVFPDLCSRKVIAMTYLPGAKLEEEAKRQLAVLGIDTSRGIKSVVRDAAVEASEPNNPESGELIRRVTGRMKSQKPPVDSWKLASASKWIGYLVGVDTILWAVRFAKRVILWYDAAAVKTLDLLPVPNSWYPKSWRSWVEDHRKSLAQARQLSLTAAWMDALFDVHGHQVFIGGRFNADPHPGNILIVEDNEGAPTNRLGLIDYGQCKELSPDEQVRIAQLVLSVANNESDERIASAFRNLGITTKNDSTQFLATFGRLIFGPFRPEHLDHKWHRRLHSLDYVMYFPKELSMVYRTSLLLRGLAVSLQLNYSVSQQWKHHAQKAIERHPELCLPLG